ncbi:MAG TPA: c-type cytochrome [Gemmatimonadaceae bacterium]|nr:c-type cytochrome [Gemmatimonadaceae bacterium]
MRHRVQHPGSRPAIVRAMVAGVSIAVLALACQPGGATTHADSSASAAASSSATSPAPARAAHAAVGSAAPSSTSSTANDGVATDTTKTCPLAPLTDAVAHASSITPHAKTDHLLVTDQEYGGWKMFHVYCYRCHGFDAIGGTFAPDLRHSVSAQGSVTPAVFVSTVLYGRLDKGMPSWRVLLDCDNVTDIWAYLAARSNGRLAAGRPHTAGNKS